MDVGSKAVGRKVGASVCLPGSIIAEMERWPQTGQRHVPSSSGNLAHGGGPLSAASTLVGDRHPRQLHGSCESSLAIPNIASETALEAYISDHIQQARQGRKLEAGAS